MFFFFLQIILASLIDASVFYNNLATKDRFFILNKTPELTESHFELKWSTALSDK